MDIFSNLFVVRFVVFVWKDKNKRKRGRGRPIFKKTLPKIKITNIDHVMWGSKKTSWDGPTNKKTIVDLFALTKQHILYPLYRDWWNCLTSLSFYLVKHLVCVDAGQIEKSPISTSIILGVGKFQWSITTLLWNKALCLAIASHVTIFNQSECFSSEYSR